MLEVCEQNQQIDTDTEHDAMQHTAGIPILRGAFVYYAAAIGA